MKNSTFKALLLLLSPPVLFASSSLANAACDQTLATTANLPSAVASAANGSTICLQNGNYGSKNFWGIQRSGYVTVRSLNGQEATLSPQIGNSKFIKFESMKIAGASIDNCANSVQINDSTFTSGLLINMRGFTCASPLDITINNNYFGAIGPAGYEGRLSIVDDDGAQPNLGVTISNNRFDGGCASDGIQLAGGSSGVTIGPGNIFENIVQSGATHCDMIQFYGSGKNNAIDGNWFRNGSVALTHHTSTPSGTRFTNNIISNITQFQIDQSTGVIFDHNTIYNLSSVFQLKSQNGSINAKSNISIGTTPAPDLTGGNTLVSYMLCSKSSSCTGSNQTIGNPIFVGGTNPSAFTQFSDWRLAANSPGKGTGHDGKDIGIANSSTAPTAIPAPQQLRVVP